LKKSYKSCATLRGLHTTLLKNKIEGICNGFQEKVKLVGIGYKGRIDEEYVIDNGKELLRKTLILNVGYSQPVKLRLEDNVYIKCESPTLISIQGQEKSEVRNLAFKIRSIRPPEPYNGKGILLVGEVIRRKAGKTGKKSHK